MAKTPNNQKTVKGPKVMPPARRAPNPRAPKPAPNVRSNAAAGTQADGTGGTGNQ